MSSLLSWDNALGILIVFSSKAKPDDSMVRVAISNDGKGKRC